MTGVQTCALPISACGRLRQRVLQIANGSQRLRLLSRRIGVQRIVFALGYSHPIEFPLPEGIEVKSERVPTKTSIPQYQLTLTLSGIDKQKLGQTAAEMHSLRKPDPYKGKGVRYADVPLKLKPGKTGK